MPMSQSDKDWWETMAIIAFTLFCAGAFAAVLMQ